MYRYFTILLYLIVNITGCAKEEPIGPQGGNSSETTNGTIAGTLYNPDGSPAIAAKVQLKDTASVVKDSTTTDNVGYYKFKEVEFGNYSILAESADSSIKWFKQDVIITKDNAELESADTLKPTFSTTLNLSSINSDLRYRLFIPELDLSTDFAPGTPTTLEGVPNGTYNAVIKANTPDKEPTYIYAFHELVVENGNTTIDTVKQFTLHNGSSSVLLDDFEDGNMQSQFNTNWFTFDDESLGGHTDIERVANMGTSFTVLDGSQGSERAANVPFTFHRVSNEPAYAGFGLHFGKDFTFSIADVSELTSITFDYKTYGNFETNFCIVSDMYNLHGLCQKNIPSTGGLWNTYTLRPSEMDPGTLPDSIPQETLLKSITHIHMVFHSGENDIENRWLMDNVNFRFQ